MNGRFRPRSDEGRDHRIQSRGNREGAAMYRTLWAAGGLGLLLLGVSGANAAGVADMTRGIPDRRPASLIEKVHSLRTAKQNLYGLGYYDVRVERATLPYSFTACKRGTRYHIHVDYYGDLVQVDEFGACSAYDDEGNDYDYGRRYRHNRH